MVELSRNIFFYKDLSLKDNFETRIILIFIHFSVIIILFKRKKLPKFPQDIFDNIFLNIEYHMRELGLGDVVVNKKMKTLNRIFYDILLKLEVNKSGNFEINQKVLKAHFTSDNVLNEDILIKLNNYFELFYNFCFELDDNSMLKGQINFKQ